MSAAGDAKRNGDRIVSARANQLVRALGIELLGRLMLKTPVDTGRARANWNISVGAEDVATDENASSADVGAKQNKGVTRIGGIDFAAGDEMYATNALPYIGTLNDGSSKQAPAKFIELTVKELEPVARQIARRTGAE